MPFDKEREITIIIIIMNLGVAKLLIIILKNKNIKNWWHRHTSKTVGLELPQTLQVDDIEKTASRGQAFSPFHTATF